MAGPAVTNIFVNSTTADASQVNQNFSDLINAMTDGTIDFGIGALTVSGTATLNGNVTLGNSLSDDITFTGALVSSIGLDTTNAYDIGSSTIGLAGVYFGSSGGAFTTRVKGAAVASSWTWTLPPTAGVSGQFPITDGSGVSIWRYVEKTTAKTAIYTTTGDETTVLCDATAGAFTVTLPAAASFSGKHYYIKKTDSSANVVTVDGNSTETIDGALTYPLISRYSAIKIISDGSNWHIVSKYGPLNRQISSTCNAFTTANTALTDVTNLTVTITTAGQPVWIGLVDEATGNTSTIASIITGARFNTGISVAILRGSTTIYTTQVAVGGVSAAAPPFMEIDVPASSVFQIDEVAAGTYTYKVQIAAAAGSQSAACSRVKLYAYEMPT